MRDKSVRDHEVKPFGWLDVVVVMVSLAVMTALVFLVTSPLVVPGE
jgi:hypothetical protein